MSQEPPPGALSSAFPPPPTFYTHFTEENLTALKSHRLEDGSLPPADSLPEPLCYLVPPPPPAGSYRAFGEEWMVPERYPSLEEAGIRQLYPPTSSSSAAANGGGDKGKELTLDRTIELRRLSKSLLLNYLELFHEKTADLETILFNMHHLINEYRPHQARETLCLRMEEQLERTRRETEENRKAVVKVENILAGLEMVDKRADAICSGGVSGDGDGLGGEPSLGGLVRGEKVEVGVAKARVRDMEAWKALVGMGG
ncbi:MED7-domain-containing protein [Choiromyces venosus 120613-1]|uniref:Mediator of RNA polymerase II transcription subunit 7 n=1 Tax=Choiromyces venosus 120613-1 TaxID=1336337 RepID=A0A3N4JIU9_9PEZI|nr:MED7-domain-containing protein [Choiromyces venosus 120613-1]